MTRTSLSYRPTSGAAAPAATGVTVESATQSYRLHLRAANLSAETVGLYLSDLGRLHRFLRGQGMPTDVGLVRREHLEAYVVALQDRGLKPATVSLAFRSVAPFWKWLVSEEEIQASPMERMRPPVVPVDPPAIVRQDTMEALLATCRGRSFEDRRDRALLLFLFDTGVRRGELVNLNVEDVNLQLKVAHVKGKARIFRAVAFGDDVAEALDRYLRVRGRHPHAADEALFLGTRGRLGGSGVLIMMRRRGREAGIEKLHPHTFRHSWAHAMLSSGATAGDVMALGGWRSRDMLDRYGSIARSERAIEAHRRLSPADRLRRK